MGSGSTDFGGLFLLTCERGSTAFDFNGGYTFIGKCAPDVLDYGVALRGTAGRLRPVGEVVGSTTRGEGTEFLIDVGLQYDTRSNITLDAAIGHGLGGSETGLFVTVGSTKNF